MSAVNNTSGATGKKTILCLHGAGSSAAICRFQSAKLRYELRHSFNFLFVNAPIPTHPGPGMLPVFEGAGPFYMWFNQNSSDREGEFTAVQDQIKLVIDESLASSGISPNIVGIMAFSQGCIAATLLLLEEERGRTLLPNILFATLVCSDYSDEAGQYVKDTWRGTGAPNMNVRIPAVHIQGRYDPFLSRSNEMLDVHYKQSKSTKLQFDGAHHFPVTIADVRKASKLILDAYEGVQRINE